MKTAPDVNGGKWTKKTLAEHIMVGGLGATSVGTPEIVADEMERWIREGDVDGFNIVSQSRRLFPRPETDSLQAYALMPQTFEDVIELLIPELRRRGIFWDGYTVPGGTYRENLYEAPNQHEPFADHPAAKMIWRTSGKTVGSALDGRPAFKGHADGSMDFEESLAEGDLLDPTAMQLG